MMSNLAYSTSGDVESYQNRATVYHRRQEPHSLGDMWWVVSDRSFKRRYVPRYCFRLPHSQHESRNFLVYNSTFCLKSDENRNGKILSSEISRCSKRNPSSELQFPMTSCPSHITFRWTKSLNYIGA